MAIATSSATPGSSATSVTFSNIPSAPKAFIMQLVASSVSKSSSRRCQSVMYDGSTSSSALPGTYVYYSSNYCYLNYLNTYSYTYDSNAKTLTVRSAGSSTGGYMHAGEHKLIYAY